MQFKRLHITDFRGIRQLTIDFEPDLTVIVGRNGAGKTSILDALGELARWIRCHLKGPGQDGMEYQLNDRDVRQGASEFHLSLDFALADGCAPLGDDGRLEIAYDLQYKEHRYQPQKAIQEWTDQAAHQPNFIHYRQNRGFADGRNSGSQFLSLEQVRTSSLLESMGVVSDLEAWWNRRDADEARTVRDSDPNYRDPQLEAVRKLIQRIDGFTGVKYSSTESPPGLRLLKTDKTSVHVNSLSGGERSFLILLADLARRLQVFSPNQSLDAIPAIVLIDEIELNLHPGWQSQIAPLLTGVFSQCQFIVTTHSPQVLSGVESSNVRALRQPEFGSTQVDVPLATKGRTSNYLLEGVLGACERFPPVDELYDQFNSAVDQRDINMAETTLAEIEGAVENDTAMLMVLKKRLKTCKANG